MWIHPWYYIPIGITIVAVLCIVCPLLPLPVDDSLGTIRDRGHITIGYAVEAPYAFVADGEVTGESPAIAKKIVQKLGIPGIFWRQVEFGSLISELETGKIDLIASGMFITPDRLERISFSLPSFKVNQGLLVKKGNPFGIHSYQEAVNQTPVKIAVLSGSVEEKMFRELRMPESRLVIVPDAVSGKASVGSGEAAGLALSTPTIYWLQFHDHSGTIETAVPFSQTRVRSMDSYGYGAFGFRKQDNNLRSAWNDIMRGLIGSKEHLELVQAFGFTREEIPAISQQVPFAGIDNG
jgi:polar amino acid transport system substrate-binding protein